VPPKQAILRSVVSATSQESSLSGTRRAVIVGLLVVGVITGILAVHTTWLKRQALDTNNWVTTSNKLLANAKIRGALGTYLADQLFEQVNISQQLQQVLPPQIAALAGPAVGAVHGFADRAAPELLARPRVQAAWDTANRLAHKQLLAILDNKGNSAVSTANGEVTLDLHPIVDQLAATLGLEGQLAKARGAVTDQQRAAARGAAQSQFGVKVPGSAGKLVILRSNQLATAQDVTQALRALSIVFTVVSLGLFALAVWLARSRRRVILRAVGWCLVGIGLATLLARRLIGNDVIDSLVRSDAVKPAVHDAWTISTSLLYDIAVALVVYGALIVLAAWLMGGMSWAVSIRRHLAPVLRDYPARVYGAVGLAYLIVLAWGPTPAFRNVIPIILIGCLLVIGVETLRRATAREFPVGGTGGDIAAPKPALGHG
jgi:hypothetical protein